MTKSFALCEQAMDIGSVQIVSRLIHSNRRALVVYFWFTIFDCHAHSDQLHAFFDVVHLRRECVLVNFNATKPETGFTRVKFVNNDHHVIHGMCRRCNISLGSVMDATMFFWNAISLAAIVFDLTLIFQIFFYFWGEIYFPHSVIEARSEMWMKITYTVLVDRVIWCLQ